MQKCCAAIRCCSTGKKRSLKDELHDEEASLNAERAKLHNLQNTCSEQDEEHHSWRAEANADLADLRQRLAESESKQAESQAEQFLELDLAREEAEQLKRSMAQRQRSLELLPEELRCELEAARAKQDEFANAAQEQRRLEVACENSAALARSQLAESQSELLARDAQLTQRAKSDLLACTWRVWDTARVATKVARVATKVRDELASSESASRSLCKQLEKQVADLRRSEAQTDAHLLSEVRELQNECSEEDAARKKQEKELKAEIRELLSELAGAKAGAHEVQPRIGLVKKILDATDHKMQAERRRLERLQAVAAKADASGAKGDAGPRAALRGMCDESLSKLSRACSALAQERAECTAEKGPDAVQSIMTHSIRALSDAKRSVSVSQAPRELLASLHLSPAAAGASRQLPLATREVAARELLLARAHGREVESLGISSGMRLGSPAPASKSLGLSGCRDSRASEHSHTAHVALSASAHMRDACLAAQVAMAAPC